MSNYRLPSTVYRLLPRQPSRALIPALLGDHSFGHLQAYPLVGIVGHRRDRHKEIAPLAAGHAEIAHPLLPDRARQRPTAGILRRPRLGHLSDEMAVHAVHVSLL